MAEIGTLELRIEQSFMTPKQYESISPFTMAPQYDYRTPQQPITATTNIHGQVWEVKAKVSSLRTSCQSRMTFSLRCDGRDDDKSWKCRAIANFHIVSQKKGVNDIVRNKVDNFSKGEWSQLESIRCDVLLDPDNGFIKNDTVIVRVHVTAEMPRVVENANPNKFVSSISDPPDGVLIVGDKRIPIHKTYLSCYSDYFKNLFRGDFKEGCENEFILEEVGYKEMLELLSVIYPSNAPITEKNIKAILRLADRFKIPSVLKQCKKELRISTKTNGALKLLMAQRYNFKDLQIQLAQQYKTTEAIKKLKSEPEYKLLNNNTLLLLFNSIGS
ncbi:BTB/POZ domain-containing protein [Ditylenchus destructor]|nr:BTB/POZ domain-containing protein [Ditylenchus destructor]